MGTFDISRINFDARKHYASARMQQGRVITDDDWNEDKRIAEFERKESLIDIIGPYGTPDDGFHIENLRLDPDSAGNPSIINFDIEAGTMYLGGLKLDLETKETFRVFQPQKIVLCLK
jgi:Cu2+-containing amine oxidase